MTFFNFINIFKLEKDFNMKITESYSVEDFEIYTDDGWKDLTSIHKTEQYEVYIM